MLQVQGSYEQRQKEIEPIHIHVYGNNMFHFSSIHSDIFIQGIAFANPHVEGLNLPPKAHYTDDSPGS